MREAPFRLNLCRDEPMIRDARWEITIDNVGDFGFQGKLCIRHRERGTWDEWPGAEDDDPPAIAAAGHDYEYEITFPTLGRAMSAAKRFLKRWGAGDVEWLEWDIDGQQHVVVQHEKRGSGSLYGWQDQPDPISPPAAGDREGGGR